jgi:hypothetical protein
MKSGHLTNLSHAGKSSLDRSHDRRAFADAAGSQKIHKPNRCKDLVDRMRPQIELTHPLRVSPARPRGVLRRTPDIPPAVVVASQRWVGGRSGQR